MTSSCSVLNVARVHRNSGATMLAIASAVIVLAGCGGSDPAFSREGVEATMTDAIREGLTDDGITMDPLDCFQDGDEFHWRCVTTTIDESSQRYRMTITVICEPETGECLSDPVAVVPLEQNP